MTEKPKRMLQVFNFMGENLTDSHYLAERRRKYFEFLGQKQNELRAWLEARGMIKKSREVKR
jgi:hypothetical protein